MKNNKKKIIIIFVALIIFVTGFLLLNTKNPVTQTETQNNIQNITVSLNTSDKSYLVKVEEGVSVYDVMKSAQNSGFSFIGKEYPSLGFFVEEINGTKGENGKYWIYSVNGEEGNVSVSKYFIKNGDNILWEQKSL